MTKIDKWLLELAIWNKKLKDINSLISDAICKSNDEANKNGFDVGLTDCYWLKLAYQMGNEPSDIGYGYQKIFLNHSDDVEGYLQENCQHAYKAHMLIQERKEIKRELGKAKRKVTAYSNRLMNSVAS